MVAKGKKEREGGGKGEKKKAKKIACAALVDFERNNSPLDTYLPEKKGKKNSITIILFLTF